MLTLTIRQRHLGRPCSGLTKHVTPRGTANWSAIHVRDRTSTSTAGRSIPRYDTKSRFTSALEWANCREECAALRNSDILKPAGDAQFGMLRHEWQPTSVTAQSIEATVAELLSDPQPHWSGR